MSRVNRLSMHSVLTKKMAFTSLCMMLLYLLFLSAIFTEYSLTVQAALFGGNKPAHT